MTGAGAGKRDERPEVTAAKVQRRQIAARAERSGLRLVPRPDSDTAPERRQSRDQALLLGRYNLYNG
jgi:hypothetical protein